MGRDVSAPETKRVVFLLEGWAGEQERGGWGKIAQEWRWVGQWVAANRKRADLGREVSSCLGMPVNTGGFQMVITRKRRKSRSGERRAEKKRIRMEGSAPSEDMENVVPQPGITPGGIVLHFGLQVSIPARLPASCSCCSRRALGHCSDIQVCFIQRPCLDERRKRLYQKKHCWRGIRPRCFCPGLRAPAKLSLFISFSTIWPHNEGLYFIERISFACTLCKLPVLPFSAILFSCY